MQLPRSRPINPRSAWGTLFLDEIGDLDLDLQAKLLRVLEQGEVQPVGASKLTRVDLRIVAATNEDLRLLVSSGAFLRISTAGQTSSGSKCPR